jgi:L-arabinose isomerase
VGPIDDPRTTEAVVSRLHGAAAATRVRRSRVARIGPVQDGYAGVDTADEMLSSRLGVEVVRLDAGEVKAAYDGVGEGDVRALRAETEELYDLRVEGEGLERSLRAACAIERLVDVHRLDAATLNCHVPEIRYGGIGVTPCFGLGRSTSRGVPWTCTGDVLTAVAMLIGTAIGGAAQYHELESYDYESDEFVLASSGEHDLRLAPEVRPALIANGWFKADPCVGACACFSAGPGPASLLAFADVGHDYRLIAADGEFTGRRFADTGTANAGFRFRRSLAAWQRWCELGAGHHSSASPGALSDAATACARFLGIEHAVV